MGTNNIFHVHDEEAIKKYRRFPYAKYIGPFLSYYHWTLCTPFRIRYEGKTGLYLCEESSIFYKIPAIIWQLVQFTYIIWGCTVSPIYGGDASSSTKAMHTLLYSFYGVYQLVWVSLMWKGLRIIPSILNEGNIIYQELLCEDDKNISNKAWNRVAYTRIIFFLLLGLVCVSGVFIAIFTLAYENALDEMSDSPHIPDFIDNLVNKTMQSFCQLGGVWCTILETDSGQGVAKTVTLAWILVMTFCETSWQTSLYMLTCWAIYFRMLAAKAVRNIKTGRSYKELFSATKSYAQISLLVEKFNELFGIFLLVIFLDTILYKTMSFATLFGAETVGIGSGVALVLGSVLPSFTMLVCMADLNKLGATVPNILKRKYILEVNGSESDHQHLSLDEVHKSLLIQSDTLSNIIGFKGAGFFVISFAFVGSVIGITITYTAVIIQFSPGTSI